MLFTPDRFIMVYTGVSVHYRRCGRNMVRRGGPRNGPLVLHTLGLQWSIQWAIEVNGMSVVGTSLMTLCLLLGLAWHNGCEWSVPWYNAGSAHELCFVGSPLGDTATFTGDTHLPEVLSSDITCSAESSSLIVLVASVLPRSLKLYILKDIIGEPFSRWLTSANEYRPVLCTSACRLWDLRASPFTLFKPALMAYHVLDGGLTSPGSGSCGRRRR